MTDLQKRLNADVIKKVNSLLIDYLNFKKINEDSFSSYIKDNIRYSTDRENDKTYFYDNKKKFLELDSPNIYYDGFKIKYDFNYNKLWIK